MWHRSLLTEAAQQSYGVLDQTRMPCRDGCRRAGTGAIEQHAATRVRRRMARGRLVWKRFSVERHERRGRIAREAAGDAFREKLEQAGGALRARRRAAARG